MIYRCIAEYVDIETGERVQPGSLVSFDDRARAQRLVEAGCIVPVREPQPERKRHLDPQPPANEVQQGVIDHAVGADASGSAEV